MNKSYRKQSWAMLWVLLALVLSSPFAQAQTQVGNEWIVPSQQYYKIKIVKDGLYKLDYQYLTQAGISGVAPSQLQIWRRGREMARYVGGSTSVLDPTTFLEFYAVHNDGRLDVELYKQPQDQPNSLYSFYTDTAAYFITWSTGAATRPGRDMAQPTAAGGAVHPNRMATQLYMHNRDIKEKSYSNQMVSTSFMPWVEPGEGYFWIITADYRTDAGAAGQSGAEIAALDSSMRSVSAVGQTPRVEVMVYGVTETPHYTEVFVEPPSGPERSLGVITYQGLSRGRRTFAIQRSDFNSAGKVVIRVKPLPQTPAQPRDFFAMCYARVTAPQNNRWFANRNSIAFQNDSLLTGPATYELDSIPATVAGFDVQDFYNVQRIAGTTVTSTRQRFVFPGATASATHQLYLADESHMRVPLPARRVYFRSINPATPNFIIITHPQLMRPATGTNNAALAYASYRANPGPGGTRYDTLMVTTAQVYDQFGYGDRSWLAMRHFARWLAAATTPARPDRYLLLLGKGIVPSETIAGGGNYDYYRNNGERGLDLVPSSSRSTSDNMLTANFMANDYVAKLHTGRLTATAPQQVMNYLNKLKTHEALRTSDAWRKNILHLIGDYDPADVVMEDYMNKAKARVERPFFGGNVITKKRGLRPDKLPVAIDISPELNAGLSMITYLGHAAPSSLALDFGKPSTSPNYRNTGKYPILMIDGCRANATFTRDTATIVESWLFAKDRGGLGSLSESSFGYTDPLGIAQDTLYKIMFNEPAFYGKPVTVINDEAVRRLQNTAFFLQDTDIEQLLTKNWQGDPAFALFAPAQPDFIANSANLAIVPSPGQGPVRFDSPNFVLNVGVSNPGKITYDSLQIRVTRHFSSSRTDQVLTFTRRQTWRADTTYALTIPNIVGESGTSTFFVALDPNNRVAESNENNNAAQLDFTFLKGGVSVLRPTEFAISASTQPQLVVQANDPTVTSRVYEFELDTVATFTSSQVRRGTVTSGLVAIWNPGTLPARLGQRDSIVWYWRSRFQTVAAGEDGSWATASFRVIPGSPGGWSQSHYAQFKRDGRTGVDVNVPNGRWDFVNTRVALDLRTVGGGVAGTPIRFSSVPNAGINIQTAVGVQGVIGCGIKSPNLLFAVYSGTSLRPVPMPASFQRCGNAPDYFYYFSINDSASPFVATDNLNSSATRQQQLDAFLTAIPDGSYVAVVSANRLTYSTLPTALKNRIQVLLGSRLINTLADGEPLTLLGQKLTATTGRLVHEMGPDRTSAIAAVDQYVTMRDTLQRSSSTGRIVSTRIGPVQEWQKLFNTIRRPSATDFYTLSVTAIDATGHETVVLPNVTTRQQQLTSLISAAQYPYIRLEAAVGDTVTRVPPQLREWIVTSRGLPEGVVRRDAVPASAYAAATLTRQVADSGYIRVPVVFQNVSDENFAAPLQTRINVRDYNDNSRIIATALVASTTILAAGATSQPIWVRVDIRNFYSKFVVEVVVNPRLQPEQDYSNNQLTLDPFTVVNNNVPPTLDVAFDGRHILNGELVSPMPVINIQLNDEGSQNARVTDRTVFTVNLLKPGQTAPTAVNLSGSEINFVPDLTGTGVSKLIYEPGKNGPLPDGVYELRVQGHDPSNANAGTQDYQVKFEVVNASQISNVYPYPNPVVSKARFVFTVTGQTLPNNMKIQIMTLTGRVVREIFMSELGPLHIGNNITDFAWDGTDTYGDRLANGTYLYRVAIDDPNSQFGHRDTAGDRAFKNDWGKLVLMR